MTYRSIITPVFAAFFSLPILISAAHAELGGTGVQAGADGSQGTVVNVPSAIDSTTGKTDSAPPAAAAQDASAPAPAQDAQAPAEHKPLLVIRFNQKRVYFDRALRQAVSAAEKTKPGVVYDVVSYTPTGQSRQQSEHMVEDAGTDLQAVVQAMQSLGVPISRMHVSNQSSTEATSPEIHIFVN